MKQHLYNVSRQKHFNEQLLLNPSIIELAKHYNKTTEEIVKELQKNIQVYRYNSGQIKAIKIAFKDTLTNIIVKYSKNYVNLNLH